MTKTPIKTYILPKTSDTIDLLVALTLFGVESKSQFVAKSADSKAKRLLEERVGASKSLEECRSRIKNLQDSAKDLGLKIYQMSERFDEKSEAWYAQCTR
jgi:hypothetical protein